MKKISMKLLAIVLTVAMLCSMLPAFASAANVVEKAEGQEISKKAEAIIESAPADLLVARDLINQVREKAKRSVDANYTPVDIDTIKAN